MQSHENAHEVIERYFATYRALPASRAKRLTATKRARIEASKRCYGAMRWHLGGHFHHQRLSPFATTEELVALHERLHADR